MDTLEFLKQEMEKEREEFGVGKKNLFMEMESLFDFIEGEVKEHCRMTKVPLYQYLAEKLQHQGYSNANAKLLGDYMTKIRAKRAKAIANGGSSTVA
ncbi:MAG TPA: hypothetical protein VM577_02205 [Anaerovoracaceae bacterium]|nr:hypothetical protein [Anaerovoracaceae bacterium]